MKGRMEGEWRNFNFNKQRFEAVGRPGRRPVIVSTQEMVYKVMKMIWQTKKYASGNRSENFR